MSKQLNTVRRGFNKRFGALLVEFANEEGNSDLEASALMTRLNRLIEASAGKATLSQMVFEVVKNPAKRTTKKQLVERVAALDPEALRKAQLRTFVAEIAEQAQAKGHTVEELLRAVQQGVTS